jgi:tRNA (cmo5U34)-methyltransferase
VSQRITEEAAGPGVLADITVPRHREMLATLVAAVPFASDETFRIVELGTGEGFLAASLLEAFPAATVVALEQSEPLRAAASALTARFDGRITVGPFDPQTLEWWDVMFGADLVVSSMCLLRLNDAKKRYVYKAVADRVSRRGAMLVADRIEPADPASRRVAADAWDRAAREQAAAVDRPELYDRFVESEQNAFRHPAAGTHPAALLHHLMWLKHAGFASADCFWLFAGHAVFGGFKRS